MKAKHGLIIGEISRFRFEEYGGPLGPNDRAKATARAMIVTENIQTSVEIKLLPAEVRALNALETKIAQRLADEIVNKGK